MEKQIMFLLLFMFISAVVNGFEEQSFDPDKDFEFKYKKPKIVVKGHVVCDQCHEGIIGKSSMPLHEAEVGIKCKDLYGFITFSAVGYTDKHGVFSIAMDDIPGIYGIKGCRATLIRSTEEQCDIVGTMGNGHTGAQLNLMHKSLKEVIFTAGPFACLPSKLPKMCLQGYDPSTPPPSPSPPHVTHPVMFYASPPPPYVYPSPPPPSPPPPYVYPSPPPPSPPPPYVYPSPPPPSPPPPYLYPSPPPPSPPPPYVYPSPPPPSPPPPYVYPSPPPPSPPPPYHYPSPPPPPPSHHSPSFIYPSPPPPFSMSPYSNKRHNEFETEESASSTYPNKRRDELVASWKNAYSEKSFP